MSHRPLPARRTTIRDDTLRGVVVEVDATEAPEALAVLQAGLHDPPAGRRLIHGYDLGVAGLGAWVSDRTVRLRVWPAYLDDDGGIEADDPDEDGSDVLVVDFDPATDRAALEAVARLGRLFIAGPEVGPTPLVLDVDRTLARRVLDAFDAGDLWP